MHLLDEGEYVFHRALEVVLVHCVVAAGQVTDNWKVIRTRTGKLQQTLTIRKVVVDGIIFRREFSKEQFGEV